MATDDQLRDPAALYSVYRDRRTRDKDFDALFGKQTSTAFIPNSSPSERYQPMQSESDNESKEMNKPADLFNAYRSSPHGSHTAAINNILENIEMERARTRLLLDHFSDTAVLGDLNQSPSLIEQIFNTPTRVLRYIQRTIVSTIGEQQTTKRTPMLALAMGVLAMLVIPFVPFNNDNTGPENQFASATLVPNSLLASAENVSGYLSPAISSSAGFSNNVSPESARFRLGSAVTRLVVAATLDAHEQIDTISNEIKSISVVEEFPSVSDSMLALASVNSNSAGDDEKLRLKIQTLNDALKRVESDTINTDWYSVGQIVESVYLSSEAAITIGDQTALTESLMQFRLLEPEPGLNDDNPLSRQFMELRTASNKSSLSLSDVRKVRAASQNIKSLLF